MNELFLAFVSLTLSGSLLALLILLVEKAMRKKFSKRWHYYIWLAVVLRLIIPFSLAPNPISSYLYQAFAQAPIQDVVGDNAPDMPDGKIQSHQEAVPEAGESPVKTPEPSTQTHGVLPSGLLAYVEYLWILWLVGAGFMFIKKATGYHAFLEYVKVGCEKVEEDEMVDTYYMVCEEMNLRHAPPLYKNAMVSAPMLVGVFHPFIVLPEIKSENTKLEYILQHELRHFKRRDIWYKWMVQIAVCLHWFNPLTRIMSAKINEYCELSCDEAVVQGMDEDQKYSYGETLLSAIHPGKGYSNTIVSITLNEDTAKIKERLDSLMHQQVHSRIARVLSFCLAVLISAGAAITGAYAATPVQQPSANVTGNNRTTYSGIEPAAYLEQSSQWQQFWAHQRATGDNALFEWPDFIAQHFNGSIRGGNVGASIFNDTPTTALVTVDKVSGSIGVLIAETDGTVRASLTDLKSGQYEIQVDTPLVSTHLQFFFVVDNFVGDVLVENLYNDTTTDKSPASSARGTSTSALKALLYDDEDAIADDDFGIETKNHFRSDISDNNTNYTISAGGLYGCRTLYAFDVATPCEVEIALEAIVTRGRFKLVHVDPDRTVTTIAERTTGSGNIISYTCNIDLTAGYGAIKLVSDNANVAMDLSISGEMAVEQSRIWK